MSDMDDKTAKAVIALISRDVVKKDDNMGKVVANFLLNEVSALFSEKNTTIQEVSIDRKDFIESFIEISYLRHIDLITTKHAKELFIVAWDIHYFDLCSYLIKSEILKEADQGKILKIIDDLIEKNGKIVEQIKKGKTNSIGFFVGQTLKAIDGKGNPAEIKEIITKRLSI